MKAHIEQALGDCACVPMCATAIDLCRMQKTFKA